MNIVIGLVIFVVVGCGILFFAAYATAILVTLLAIDLAHHAGAGDVGAFGVGIGAGLAYFAVGKFLAEREHPAAATAVLVLFAVPAAIAGFLIVWTLSDGPVTSAIWRWVLSINAALLLGGANLVALDRDEL